MQLAVTPCRCLDTASIVLADMPTTDINTEELIRETLGSDTCDARRSVSDPPGGGKPDTGPCAFDRGLKSKYPQYSFPGRGCISVAAETYNSACQLHAHKWLNYSSISSSRTELGVRCLRLPVACAANLMHQMLLSVCNSAVLLCSKHMVSLDPVVHGLAARRVWRAVFLVDQLADVLCQCLQTHARYCQLAVEVALCMLVQSA